MFVSWLLSGADEPPATIPVSLRLMIPIFPCPLRVKSDAPRDTGCPARPGGQADLVNRDAGTGQAGWAACGDAGVTRRAGPADGCKTATVPLLPPALALVPVPGWIARTRR